MRRALQICSIAFMLLVQGIAAAQTFPEKGLRIIVPVAAGGGADVMTRVMATALAERIGHSVVVENRGGAGGNIGMEAGARVPADGYTLTMVFQSMGANPYLYAKLPFDVVKDFAPVSVMVHYQLVLAVNPLVPAQNIAELIALAKAKPDTLTYGSSGAGGASHLTFEQFMSRTGTRFTHIPYKGNAPAMTDLIGGRITAIVDALAGTLPHIRAGTIRPLGVASKHRSTLLPDVPAIAETVPDFEMLGWLGMVAPAGTPPERVAYWSREIAAVLNIPSVKQRLTETGNEVIASTPEEFAKFLQTELRKYEKLIREAGIKANQ